jgi:hypothetical protein
MIRNPEVFKAAARFVFAAESMFRQYEGDSRSVMYSFKGEFFRATKIGTDFKVIGMIPAPDPLID